MKPLAITSILCLLLFTGCSGDEDIRVEKQEDKVPLYIASALVENADESHTRAVTPVPLTSGSIGIFLEGAAGTSYAKKDNIQYNYGASKWEPNVTSETLYLGGENANVCAYFKTPKINLSAKETVALTSQIFDTDQDLLYAGNKTVNGTSAGKVVEFILSHAYSQLEFVLSHQNYPNTCKVTKIQIQNPKVAATTTLNIATGQYGTPVLNSDFSYNTNGATGIVVPASPNTIKSNVLMIPCELANVSNNGLTLVLTVDGKPMTTKIPYAKLSALVAGTKHQITVILKGTAIDVSVKDTPWSSVAVDGNYSPEPVAPQP